MKLFKVPSVVLPSTVIHPQHKILNYIMWIIEAWFTLPPSPLSRLQPSGLSSFNTIRCPGMPPHVPPLHSTGFLPAKCSLFSYSSSLFLRCSEFLKFILKLAARVSIESIFSATPLFCPAQLSIHNIHQIQINHPQYLHWLLQSLLTNYLNT